MLIRSLLIACRDVRPGFLHYRRLRQYAGFRLSGDEAAGPAPRRLLVPGHPAVASDGGTKPRRRFAPRSAAAAFVLRGALLAIPEWRAVSEITTGSERAVMIGNGRARNALRKAAGAFSSSPFLGFGKPTQVLVSPLGLEPRTPRLKATRAIHFPLFLAHAAQSRGVSR